MSENFQIRPFQPGDQESVHNLILEGLADHFDAFDPTLNPDLRDIDANYLQQGALVLVVESEGQIVGTGALVVENEITGRIVRVSVASSHRRLGIGRLITEQLILSAREFPYTQIVVETNDDWYGAIHLYQSCGFTKYDHYNGEIHMILHLAQ